MLTVVNSIQNAPNERMREGRSCSRFPVVGLERCSLRSQLTTFLMARKMAFTLNAINRTLRALTVFPNSRVSVAHSECGHARSWSAVGIYLAQVEQTFLVLLSRERVEVNLCQSLTTCSARPLTRLISRDKLIGWPNWIFRELITS